MKTLRTTFLVCCLLTFRQFLQAAPPQGYVIEWGRNTAAGTAAPAKQVLSNAVAISAGRLHCLALKSDGTVVQWGGNFRGEADFNNTVLTTGEGGSDNTLLIKNTTKIMTNGVVKINGQILSNIVSIAAGDGFSLALKKDRTVIGWGENYVPVKLTNITAIAAESGASWVLKSDGTVVGWTSQPSNYGYGQLLPVENLSNVVAIAMGPGEYHTRGVALKSDGTVAHWGSESIYNDETSPVGLSNVVAIAAGSSHTLAVKSDGTVIGWGFNKVGQATGIPTTNSPNISAGQVMIEGQILNNVVSVAANHGYSMALKKDGTIITWGRMVNDLYPVTVPEGLSNVVAIAAGDNFCLAITTNSAVADKFRH